MQSSNFGNAFFGLTFLFLAAVTILQLRVMDAPAAMDITLGIHSIDDYEELVDIYPLDKIPEEAHRSIANSLIFNHQDDLLAGSVVEIQTFLNIEEQEQFLSLLFGAKVNFINNDAKQKARQVRTTVHSNDTGLFLVHEVNGKFQILTGV